MEKVYTAKISLFVSWACSRNHDDGTFFIRAYEIAHEARIAYLAARL